jgi:hypothetical protein
MESLEISFLTRELNLINQEQSLDLIEEVIASSKFTVALGIDVSL